jgi:hypothetical protein
MKCYLGWPVLDRPVDRQYGQYYLNVPPQPASEREQRACALMSVISLKAAVNTASEQQAGILRGKPNLKTAAGLITLRAAAQWQSEARSASWSASRSASRSRATPPAAVTEGRAPGPARGLPVDSEPQLPRPRGRRPCQRPRAGAGSCHCGLRLFYHRGGPGRRLGVPAAAAGGCPAAAAATERARHHRAASESPAEMAGSLSLMRHPLQRATEAEDHAGGRH